MTDIIGDSPCPACRERGRDKSGNHLILFSDGGAYCNRCEYSEPKDTFTEPAVRFSDDRTEEEIRAELEKVVEESTVRAIDTRMISLQACEHFGVRVSLSEQDGKTQTSWIYPRYALSDGSLQGYKIKYPSKFFGRAGKTKDSMMFGEKECPRSGNKIFVTEGEDDALALYDTLYAMSKPDWRKSIAVISLQNGAKSADKSFLQAMELLKGFKEIVLCFDMDEDGKAAVDKVVNVLGRDKIKVAEYPEKDANAMVMEGLSRELYFSVLKGKDPRPEKVISGNQITLEDLLVPLKKGLAVPYPKLMERLHGFRYGDGGGELTIMCAGSGMGKTTLAREIMYCFNKQHHLPLGHIFLEENHRKTGQSYIAIDNNVPVAALREDPSIIDIEAFSKSHQELIANGRTHFLTHFGSLASNSLMDYMNYLGISEGCGTIMLDHISMVVSGQEAGSGGERKDIDMLMTQLAAFCETTGVSVIAIVHLKRPERGSFNDGGKISLTHLRGSAAIEQLSHNIIGIEGDQHGDEPNQRTIRLLKNREWGDVGECDVLEYNPNTGRLLPADVSFGGGF